MADIKIKDVTKKTIKVIDKGTIATERFKDTIVHTKERAESSVSNETNNTEYANDKIKFVSNRAKDEAIYNFNKYGKKSVGKTKENFIKSKAKLKDIKIKKAEKLAEKSKNITTKTTKATKTTIKTSKEVAKNTEKIAKETAKVSQRAVRMAKEAAKETVKTAKAVGKATIAAIKGMIAATKALITAIIAGGWVAVVVILIICLIGLLCSSIFGIFFSSEKTDTRDNAITMSSIVSELNNEMADKIKTMQNDNSYDDYVITSDRAEWKEILAVYTARISKGNNENEVITLDDNKKAILKEIFWDMNTISSSVKNEQVDEEYTEDGETKTRKVNKNILHITISSKNAEEMSKQYGFNSNQKKQLNELLDTKYANLWSSVIFGTSVGSPNIVQIALSQVGNVGGEPFWSWYGFDSRVEWCACFVSWVANQAGYIESNVVPKFAGCENGVNWFKAVGEWKEPGFIPKAGDIIFFDWEVDGKVNHVGIVEKVENNKVYTVEGNSTNDTCRQKEYDINSNVIYGYGTPAY